MARRQTKVSAAQRLTGYAILTVLGLIVLGLLMQQAHFNPAVNVALKASPPGRPQAGASPAPAATAALIPEVEGFTPRAPAESFGPETLSDKIDGRAELYLAAGFKEMSCRSFGLDRADKAYVEVFIYDMGSPSHAYAVFSGQRRASAASSPLTANAYSTANALFFTQGQFYVELVADRASESLPGSLQAYAQALLARLPAQGETRQATALFPKEGLAPETLRLSAADTFGLEGLNNVFTGEYHLKTGQATAFLAPRQTAEQAQAEAKRYLDFLAANGYQKSETPGAAADFQVLALDNSFEIVFVQDKTLAGVHDATSAAAALELAARLRSGLKGQP
jgi:hypothetical protein